MAEGSRVRVVLAAFLRRALLDAASYRAAQLLRLGGFVAATSAFVFLARLVDTTRDPGLAGRGGYSGFVLLGIIVADLQRTTLSALASRIREAQLQGTLEALLATPTPAWLVLLGIVLPDLFAALLRGAAYLVTAGLVFGLPLGRLDALPALVALLLALLAFASLGLLAAAVTLRLRRADPLGALLSGLSLIAGTVLYPRSVLPPWLDALGGWLPITPALAALRASFFGAGGFAVIASPLARLAVFAALLGPLGGLLFARSLARARDDGSLITY